MSEKTYSCRLKDDEEHHLNSYWSSFSDFVHSAFRQDIQKVKTNKKKNRIQRYGQNMIYLGFGIIILFQMLHLGIFSLSWFIVFALGMSFFGMGFYGIALEVKHARG